MRRTLLLVALALAALQVAVGATYLVLSFFVGEIKGEGFGLEQSGWINWVGVHPREMGAGIGQALAKKLFEFFKKKGILDVYTAVRWDAPDMLSFFKSIGFDRSTFINLRKHLD